MEIFGLRALPEIVSGDNLVRRVIEAARRECSGLRNGDIVVLAQKIVSKAEGRVVSLAAVQPSAGARSLARTLGEDARFLEVVLRESRRIVRMSERTLIVETHHGFTCANAGVDRSNVPGKGRVCCLPVDPDASARRVADAIRKRLGVRVAVIICDTFGRPWRLGLTNVAIGAAGLEVLKDLRGKKDSAGRRLHATILAVADELASAAGLVLGKMERVPAAVIRGYAYTRPGGNARQLIRPVAEDMFR